VRIDRAHDEMVVIAGNCCVFTWPRLADGAGVNTIRRILWGGNTSSQLNNPVGLALNRQRGEIVVGDYKDDSGAGYPNRIFVFSRLADGLGARRCASSKGRTRNWAAAPTCAWPSTRKPRRSSRSSDRSRATSTIRARARLRRRRQRRRRRCASSPAVCVARHGDRRISERTWLRRKQRTLLISIANTNPNARGRIVVHAKNAFGSAFRWPSFRARTPASPARLAVRSSRSTASSGTDSTATEAKPSRQASSNSRITRCVRARSGR
jgi:hypothetical protein